MKRLPAWQLAPVGWFSAAKGVPSGVKDTEELPARRLSMGRCMATSKPQNWSKTGWNPRISAPKRSKTPQISAETAAARASRWPFSSPRSARAPCWA